MYGNPMGNGPYSPQMMQPMAADDPRMMEIRRRQMGIDAMTDQATRPATNIGQGVSALAGALAQRKLMADQQLAMGGGMAGGAMGAMGGRAPMTPAQAQTQMLSPPKAQKPPMNRYGVIGLGDGDGSGKMFGMR